MEPFSLLSRIDTSLIYAPFLEAVLDMLEDCWTAGHEYHATLGFRTWAQQAQLYAQGRGRPGVKVTDAPAGYSAHNYGIAIDFFAAAPHGDGEPVVPVWTEEAFNELGRCAKLRGLVWGGDWTVLPDRPHLQWPGYVTGEQLEPLRLAYGQPAVPFDGLARAWHLLDEQEHKAA